MSVPTTQGARSSPAVGRSTAKRRLSGIILFAAFALLTVGAAPAQAFSRTAYEAKLLGLINLARTDRGLRPVAVVKPLDKAALAHSRDMLAHDYFAHSTPSGAGVSARARSAGYSVGSCSQWSVGELLAWGKGSRGTPRAVFRSWMRSRAHRKVILAKRWRDVGVGCARGRYRSLSRVVMYTVDFGRRVQ